MPDWLYWMAAIVAVVCYLQRERFAAIWIYLTSGKPSDSRMAHIAELVALRDSFAADTRAQASCDTLISKVAARAP